LVDLGYKISERTDESLQVQFYSMGSVFWFNGSIQSSFMRLFHLRTTPTGSHSSLFLLLIVNPRDIYFLGYEK